MSLSARTKKLDKQVLKFLIAEKRHLRLEYTFISPYSDNIQIFLISESFQVTTRKLIQDLNNYFKVDDFIINSVDFDDKSLMLSSRALYSKFRGGKNN